MSKYTQGPWYVGDANVKLHAFSGVHGSGDEDFVICDLCNDGYAKDTQDANARLIAAAPDLLEALQRSLNWLSSYPGGGAIGCYDQALAAIRKATGDQP